MKAGSKMNSKYQLDKVIPYVIFAIALCLVSGEVLADFDLKKFGTGMTTPVVTFVKDFWYYGTGAGGAAAAVLGEGDGRTRIVRGLGVFVGASAVVAGIIAMVAP